MKTISCKDMGIDCANVSKGESDEEVINKLNEHIMRFHPDVVTEMSRTMTEQEMMEKMVSKVNDK